MRDKAKQQTLPPGGAAAETIEQKVLRAAGLHRQGRLDQARALYGEVLQVEPVHFDALHLLGLACAQGNDLERGVELMGRAIAVNPGDAAAHNNLGNALQELGRFEAALQCLDRAIELDPGYAEAHGNRGLVRQKLGQYAAAVRDYGTALAKRPDYAFLYGMWLHSRMHICDWDGVASALAQLAGKIERGEKATRPFPVLAMSDDPGLQRKAAEIWARETLPPDGGLPEIAARPQHDRIRVGYFSADFYSHATALLMAELFERHDRSRFEVVAFSFGPNRRDEMGRRVAAAFERFIDVERRSDREVALLARELELDIAVDLKGFTTDSRPEIFAFRVAPVQVSYLGYPGTMGADYIDYLIADPTLVPESHRQHYAEKIAYLPGSYQVNDTKRAISERIFSRAELGLPEAGFVFCCFNSNYKILPHVFDIWMRLLRRVEGSVLWLLEGNEAAAANLRREAVARGVAAERLVFARRLPPAEHLARHRLADLFLDTLPYNAHTTASDALWAGLPVLTCLGGAFAGRVAASLLRAVDLPELVTETLEDYEALALELATDQGRLAGVKLKLKRNRLATPLFDTALFTRHIEAAYTMMHERRQAGLPPAHLHAALAAPDGAAMQAVGEKVLQAAGLHRQGRLAEAQAIYEKVLQAQPMNFDALHLLGVACAQIGTLERAEELMRRAIVVNPDEAAVRGNYGNVLKALARYEAALESYDMAIALNPADAETHNNRGNVLFALRRYDAALESYDRAIALAPDHAVAHSNRGNALQELRRFEAALLSLDKAVALDPGFAVAHCNRGLVQQNLKRYPEAVQSYERALSLELEYDYLHGAWLHCKMLVCDWNGVVPAFSLIAEEIERGEKAARPFHVLGVSNDPALQGKAAEIWMRETLPPDGALPEIAAHARHDRIRIGYFSADFYNHATALLMAELFERHDRSRFELIAFSFGPDRRDEMGRRVAAAFERFIDVEKRSDREVALLARELELDIAVDLKGFTQEGRPRIFALGAAPVQVSYLGYPGTMGASYIDYLIADPTLIPESHRQYYAEKIAYLPDSYQVNDSTRVLSERVFSRAELGLPETGFVFCCFNSNYKILPHVFDIWMRLLQRVEGSVLWLLDGHERVAGNLRREAAARGVAANRLVFAARLPPAEHLARHRLADLFLDTLPYNAHTTASDALWAGLPVLTCLGEAFAGRVAASLLRAIDLPELVTETLEEYEALAVELATDPERLAQLKLKLERNRLVAPLFDTALFARHIEAAYTTMHKRRQFGLPPAHLHVPSG